MARWRLFRAVPGEELLAAPSGWLDPLLGGQASLPRVIHWGWRGVAVAPPSIPPEIRARRWSRAEYSPHTLERPASQAGLRPAGAIRARTT